MAKRAVILLSGGLDSATALAEARAAGFESYALTVNYGQRHHVELDAARRVADSLGVHEHKIVALDLRAFGHSALTADLAVPKDRDEGQLGGDVPVTYVPARNTILLALALAWAETLDAADIFIGVNAVDYSGYPDCRPEFIESFQRLARLATKAALEGGQPLSIHTPLIDLTKAEIIRRGLALGVDYSLTHSCYDPDAAGLACGRCDSCRLRQRGFADAAVPDPTRYAPTPAN